MTLLNIGDSGLFHQTGGFFHVLASALKLGAGGVFILVWTVVAYVASLFYSVYKGIEARSVMRGARTLIHSIGYVMGVGAALTFALLAGIFFGISVLKLLFLAVVIGFAVSFISRETLLFVVLKKFGTYVMALSVIESAKDLLYPNGKQQTQSKTWNKEGQS
jgi:hypothetical protein